MAKRCVVRKPHFSLDLIVTYFLICLILPESELFLLSDCKNNPFASGKCACITNLGAVRCSKLAQISAVTQDSLLIF